MASQVPTDTPAGDSRFTAGFNYAIDSIAGLVRQGAENFSRNAKGSFADMVPKDYIRLAIIICGYLLLRPHLVNFGMSRQKKMHAKAGEEARAEDAARNAAAISANDLRKGGKIVEREVEGDVLKAGSVATGQGKMGRQYGMVRGPATKVQIPGVADSSDEEEEGREKAQWGKKARVRQRKFVRKVVESEEKRLQEEDSDREIEELLED